LKMPAFEWVHVQLHQQKGMISLSPPTICNSAKLDRETAHRQVKYLNNVIEADHGKLKILIKPVRGFKSIPTAYATIKGFEVMRALRKGQARPWCLQPGIRGEVRLVERAFGIGPSALTEAMGMLNHHFAAAA
ncbi:transposase, partial [Escherichia coli]|uniref:transposase n=1 Tax=Escherichia coli TaxID=562 RepID=UPI002010ADF9